MKIKYKIEIFSDWQCGSGLDSGTDADTLVIKDKDRLPYIPGRTIKGLLRDALTDINEAKDRVYKKNIEHIFGKINQDRSSESGCAFFSNAEISYAEKQLIIEQGLTNELYHNIASTAIGENGIAQEKSLRVMQVAIPLTLEGHINNLDGEDEGLILMAFKWTRHLGNNRNRGLGRCKFAEIDKVNNKVNPA